KVNYTFSSDCGLLMISQGGTVLDDQELAPASFSPDGLWLARVSEDGTMHVWDTVTRKVTTEVQHAEMAPFPLKPTFSPDGRRVVSNFRDDTVGVWDVITGKILTKIKHKAR